MFVIILIIFMCECDGLRIGSSWGEFLLFSFFFWVDVLHLYFNMCKGSMLCVCVCERGCVCVCVCVCVIECLRVSMSAWFSLQGVCV